MFLAAGWVCTAAARGGPGDAAEEPECGAGPGERCPWGRRLLQRGGQPVGSLPGRRHRGRPPTSVAGQRGSRPSLYEVRTKTFIKILIFQRQMSIVEPENHRQVMIGVFGPPESGFISTRSGSFHKQAKIVRKTLIPTVFLTFYDF